MAKSEATYRGPALERARTANHGKDHSEEHSTYYYQAPSILRTRRNNKSVFIIELPHRPVFRWALKLWGGMHR